MADAEADTAQIASPVAPGPGILGRLGMTLREVALAGVLLVLFAVVIGLSVGVSKAGGGGGQKSQSGGSGVPPNTCMTPECLELSASLLANVDSSQDPCQDFHKYACGLWAIRHPVPPARREVKFIQKVRRGQKEKVRALLDERIARGDMNSFERKVKEVWLSCMDDFGRMTARANPMLNIINGSLGGWYVMDKNWNQTYNPNWTFQKAFTSAQKDFLVDALFKIEVRPDPKDTTRAMIHVSQSGLGMPQKDYGNPGGEIGRHYDRFMATVGRFLVRDAGFDQDRHITEKLLFAIIDIVTFETRLAQIIGWTPDDSDPYANSARVTLKELNRRSSFIDWSAMFSDMFSNAGVNENTEIMIMQEDYVNYLDSYIDSLKYSKQRVLNNYLVWRTIQTYIPHLSKNYIHAASVFQSALTGRKETPEDYVACFDFVEDRMGAALGALYSQSHYGENDVNKMKDMVTRLTNQLKSRLGELDWMDAETVRKASDKLDAMEVKIGHPSYMDDNNAMDNMYKELTVMLYDYFSNVRSTNAFKLSQMNKELSEGEDKSVWRNPVYAVIANMYNQWNEFFIPGGGMQFPLFVPSLPDYYNYGGMASLLSFQLLKAVDFRGRNFMPDGSKNTWWSTQTRNAYAMKQDCIAKYFNDKTAGPYRLANGRIVTVHINGQKYATPGAAFQGGGKLAYSTYKALMQGLKVPERLLPGWQNWDQVFFLSWAQTQCFTRRDPFSYQRALNTAFPPEDIGLNGALSHMEEFQAAFKCPAGSPMNAGKKCDVY